MFNRRVSSALLATLLGAMSVATVSAENKQAAVEPVSHEINIPAGPLADALEKLGDQSGVQILYEPAAADGVKVAALNGRLTVSAALSKLLANTGLQADSVNEKTIVLKRPHDTATSMANLSSGIRVAQTQPGAQKGGEDSTASPGANDTESLASVQNVGEEYAEKGIPEMLVKGSKSLNTDIRRTMDGPQPYVVFDRQLIERSGAANVEQLLKTRLTMSTSSVSNERDAGTLGNVSNINLRGLGSDETLILIDGRRAVGYGYQGASRQPDINSIPVSAIERIEILPTTASGVYGGGATGGVINIIMRRDYAGVETHLAYDNAFSANAQHRRADLSSGFQLEGGRTSVLLAGSWSDGNSLRTQDRDFFEQMRARVIANNPASILGTAIPPIGYTTNIRSSNGANLTLKASNQPLGSPVTSVPVGYAGVSSDQGAALAANAGRYNLALADTAQYGGGRLGLLNAPTIRSVSGTVRRSLTNTLDAVLEVSAASNEGTFPYSLTPTNFTIAASAPANPFNEAIRVATPTLGADQTLQSKVSSERASGGLIWRFGNNWVAGADYTYNRSRYRATLAQRLNTSAATAAMSSGLLNIFADVNAAAPDYSQFFVAPAQQFVKSPNTLSDTTLRISGPLGNLMWIEGITLTTMFEHRAERFSDFFLLDPQTTPLMVPGRAQKTDSVYLETILPLVSAQNRIPGLQLVELQLATRHDRYRVAGANSVAIDSSFNPIEPVVRSQLTVDSTDPTMALRVQPVADITVRASYGTGFLPPGVQQVVPLIGSSVLPGSSLSFLTDTRRDEPLGATGNDISLITQGPSALRPERSKSRSAGFILTPRWVPDLRFSVDWTRIEKRDNITTVATFTQADFANEVYVPGLITRGPLLPGDTHEVGPVIGINSGLFNISRLSVEAVDFSLGYGLSGTSVGGFDFNVAATNLRSLQTQLTPIAPVVEHAGVGTADNIGGANDGGGLKWRTTGSVTWNYRDWSLSWVANFYDSYFLNTAHTVNPGQGSATVPSQIYHDLTAVYRLPFAGRAPSLPETELMLGVRNVFNKAPPIDVVGRGFSAPGYSYYGDPRLASYYVSLKMSFGAR